MNDDKICIICYDKCDKECEDIDDIDYIVNCECKVNYHKKCIEEWLNIKNKCPICRQPWECSKNKDYTLKYISCYCTINILYLIAVIVVL